MELKVKWTNEPQVNDQLKMNMDQLGEVVRNAMREAAHEIADFIQARGADDIEDAGNFGDRWADAFRADVTETQRTVRVEVSMQAEGPPVVYWPVFEYGAHIEAKNPSGMMWIPFAGGVFGSTAGGADVWPRAYGGGLFRKGNVLFDEKDELPRYFGTPSVTIPKKFHLHEIAEDEASKAGDVFSRVLAEMMAEENGR